MVAVLVGFMGAGKTTVGRIIAERLGQPFVDSDVLIEQRLGREIREIFATEGEACFRELEHATVADLVPLRGENRRLVQQGLKALAASGKPGIRALVAVSGTDPSDLDAGALGEEKRPVIIEERVKIKHDRGRHRGHRDD